MKLSEVTGQAAPKRMKLSEVMAGGGADLIPKKKSGLPLREFAMAGAPGFFMSPGSEDVLPAVGQALGTPGGFVGSVGGAAVGEVARQGVKALRGESSIKPSELVRTAIAGPPGLPKALSAPIATTAGTEGIFRGAGKLIKKPLEGTANRLMLSVMKPGREVIKRRPNLGIEAAEAGIYGTKKGMLEKAGKIVKEGEKQILPLLKNRPQKVNILNVAAELDEIKKPFLNVGDDAAIKAIDEVQNNLLSKSQTGLIGLEEANQLKRDLYKVLKSSQYGKGIGEVPVKATARKQAAYGIRKEIEGAVPEISPISKQQSIGIEAREALENRLADEAKHVIIPKLAGMGAGGVALSGNPMGGLGILAGNVAFDILRSSPSLTGTAKNLLRLRKSGRPLTLAAAEMARRLSENYQS